MREKCWSFFSRAWDKENSKSLPPFPPSPLSLQEDLASSKVSSVKELRESKFLGSVIDEREIFNMYHGVGIKWDSAEFGPIFR